jgi:hypothetical protein
MRLPRASPRIEVRLLPDWVLAPLWDERLLSWLVLLLLLLLPLLPLPPLVAAVPPLLPD